MLRSVQGHRTAESVQDLHEWVRHLDGCPPVTRTVAARCTHPVHGDETGTWFFVEADAEAGVARTRCLGCGDARPLLDSTHRWTFPPAWSCPSCRQAIAEVVFGVHEEDGVPTWLVVTARCVECGQLEGLTDLVVTGYDGADLLAEL